MKHNILIPFFFLLFILQACTTDSDDATNNQETSVNKAANKKATGSASNDILSDDTYKSMVIELVYVDGFAPTQAAQDNFVSFLEARTHKPNGITIEKRAINSPEDDRLTIEEIVAIEDANRTKYNTNDTIAIWAFFTDGESDSNSEDSVVLGTAYRNTSFVIFEESIHDLSNSPFEPNRNLLEATVINHEFGHILGLTNLGATPQSDHEDPDHEKHCNVESCLMYWAVESAAGIANMIGSNSIPQLDDQCIADLRANGGK
ncbi:membrane metalloprotease [Snuella sedimenti]|uniref:Membrane metalloprotease n=1 Tax=Snuella sedimenti TaxID=2798802 RepID=A0A8J7IFN7_9FLAO|nr:membrane metalloprotease [Snuella sedimenti]MBJ6366933.1 membrane metalloprotease [Snuella sedimenti]